MQGALAADLKRSPNVDVVVVYDTNHLSALVFESIGHDSVLELLMNGRDGSSARFQRLSFLGGITA